MIILTIFYLFLNIYLIKLIEGFENDFEINYDGWTKRVQTESPRYEVQLNNPLESRYEREVKITLTDEAKKMFNKWDDFEIKFETTLFVTTKRKTELHLQICDNKRIDKIKNKKFETFEMSTLIFENNRCKEDEEFKFELKTEESREPPNKYDPARTDLLFSLTNFTFTIFKQTQQVSILLNDTSNFIFEIDNEQIEDYSKLYLNEYFPLFNREVDEFWFVDNFKEITVHEMNFDEMQIQNSKTNQMDYCFNFRYYNVDNSVSLKMTAANTDFQFNLIDLDSTYYESRFTSYSWFRVKDLCIMRYFKKPTLFPSRVQFKLVRSNYQNYESGLFALNRMSASLNAAYASDTNSYFLSWNRTIGDARTQWITVPLLPDNFIFDKFDENVDYRLKLTVKPQSRIMKYILFSKLIEYQPNGVLKFDMNNKIDQLDLKIQWFDQMNTLLKTNLFELVSKNETKTFEIEFNEQDKRNFSSNIEKSYRVVMTFTLPNDSIIALDKNYNRSNKIYQPSIQEKTLIISKLNYLDPCKEDSCLNKGECIGLTGKNFKCICNELWAGEHCEYINRCTGPMNHSTSMTGQEYCGQFGANVNCRAVNNYFECNCLDDLYWNQESKKCVAYDGCTFKICGLNEKCTLNTKGIASCECKEQYTFNKTSGRCELFLCDNINVCSINEDCINVAGRSRGTCVCKIGYVRSHGTCKKLKDDNPFIIQELGCEHNFEILKKKNNTAVCTCLPGYVLQNDGKRCKKSKDFLNNDECEKCDLNRQICIKESNGDIRCICKNGYSGENCLVNFCEQTNNEDLKLICGDQGCKLNTKIEKNYRFECKCDPKFSELNVTTGKCEIKDSCDQETVCSKMRANCVPMIKMVKKEEQLSHRCDCKNNEIKNSVGVCIDRCEKKCSDEFENDCELDLLNNSVKCTCKRGYIYSEQDDRCIIISNALNLTVNMVLRSTNKILEENLYENDYISVCYLLSDPRNCILKYDALYRHLNYDNIDKKVIDQFIKSQIKKQLKDGFNTVITERPFALWVTSYKNLSEINYDQWGFKTNFSVNITIASRFDEKNETPLSDHVTIKRIKDVCHPNKLNLKRERRYDENKNDLINQIDTLDCIIVPTLILYNLKIIKPIEENICEIQDVVKCPAYSNCRRFSKGVSYRYKCRCDDGFFASDYSITDNKIEVPIICEDHDECKDARFKNYCNQNTTICENTPGSYKCTCFDNFKRISAYTCDEACGKNMSIKCEHGECVIIDKHFERCICKDGWKSDDCSIEVEKVKLLKKMLFLTTVGLCLVIIVLSLTACYFYVKRSNEILDIDKSERSDRSDQIGKKDVNKKKTNSYVNQIFDDKIVPMTSIEIKDDTENVIPKVQEKVLKND